MAPAALVLAVGACDANNPRYFPEGPPTPSMEVGGEVDGMAGPTEAKATVALKFRAPTDAEREKMNAESDALGYEVPWLREDRVHLEVLYTVTNLDDREGKFELRIDGASEFTRYDEDAVASAFDNAGEDPVLFGLMEAIPQILAPGQVYQGTIREDDFHEASLDIDALGRFMAPFVTVVTSRSDAMPVGLDNMPQPYPVRPALWEVTLRLASQLHMRCDFLVRVRDDDGRLFEEGEPAFDPQPETFMPPVVMQ